MHQLERYKPSDEPHRLVLSNMQYGLLHEFHKRGVNYTITVDEALQLDQRAFGPAYARGLFDSDGNLVWMTPNGHDYVRAYEGRSPWKEAPGTRFSHYIKIMRMVSSNGQRERGRPGNRSGNRRTRKVA